MQFGMMYASLGRGVDKGRAKGTEKGLVLIDGGDMVVSTGL